MNTQIDEQIKSGHEISIPESLKEWLAAPKRNFVGGDFVIRGRQKFETKNPATQETLATIDLGDWEMVRQTVEVARVAFDKGEWRKKDIKERAETVRRLGDLILEHRATLALLESLDTGKPIRESFDGDILRAASNFHFFADFAEHENESMFRSQGHTHLAFREPLGVALLITPWNLPLYLETWKIAPSLMMGNSVILKPSELTPLTALYFCELVEKSGLPKGVFNCLQGLGENSVGEWLVSDRGIDAISFTGETGTGRAIMRSAASGPTKVSFELGGKGASVVFADADLDRAVETCLRAAFRNQGEICLASPRLFVDEKVYDKFLEKFVAGAKAIRVGNPLDYRTGMGALISEEHYKKVLSYVSEVPEKNIACGGTRPDLPAPFNKGNYLSPTVFIDLPVTHRSSREEIFGPVVSIHPFKTEDEAIEWVNSTPYGLSASIWTADLNRAFRVGKGIKKGMVWVNNWFVRDLRVPFGGQKRSGLGREGGKYSLDFFSEWKSLCLPM